MKKFKSLFILLTCLMMVFSFVSCKEEPEPYYGKMTVKYYNPNRGIVANDEKVINVLNGIITADTLKQNGIDPENVTEISLNGIYEIGDNAFEGCKNLTEVIVPSSVRSIGSKAFATGSEELKVILQNDDVVIAEDAFEGNEGEKVIIEGNDNVFSYSVTLSFEYVNPALPETVKAPASVTVVGNTAAHVFEKPADPENVPEGYEAYEGGYLVKWYKGSLNDDGDLVLEDDEVDFNEPVSESTTYYGVFNPIEYTVYFSTNYGTADPDYVIGGKGIETDYDTMVSIPVAGTAYPYDVEGYHVAGWSEDKELVKDEDGVITSTIYKVVGDDALTEVGQLTTEPGAKVYLYFVAAANGYSVQFDSNNKNATGDGIEAIDAEFDKDFVLPEFKGQFALIGYHFVGWSTRSNAEIPEYTNEYNTVRRNLCTGLGNDTVATLYAVWDPNTYTVNFLQEDGVPFEDIPTEEPSRFNSKYWLNNGKLFNQEAFDKDVALYSVRSQEFEYDADITLPKDALLAPRGYHVVGWETRKEGGVEVDQSFTGASVKNLATGAEDDDVINLYLTISPNTYLVKFDANVADDIDQPTIDMKPQSMIIDQEDTLRAAEISRPHYTFAGWNTEADGTGVSYDDKESVTNLSYGEDVTLYAVWTPDTYTINFYNGETKKTSQTFTYGADAEGDFAALYKNLEEETLKLRVEGHDAMILVGWSFEVEEGNDLVLAFADGCSLENVSTDSNIEKLYSEFLVDNASDEPKNSVDLYAVWEEACSVNLTVDEGHAADSTEMGTFEASLVDGKISVLPDPADYQDFIKFGYNIVGWEDSEGTVYNTEDGLTFVASELGDKDNDITFTAILEPINYTVKLMTKDGNAEIATITTNYDKDITSQLMFGNPAVDSEYINPLIGKSYWTTREKYGFHILGWATTPNALEADIEKPEGSDTIKGSDLLKSGDSVTLYVVNTENVYTINIFYNDGTTIKTGEEAGNPMYSSIEVKYGSEILSSEQVAGFKYANDNGENYHFEGLAYEVNKDVNNTEVDLKVKDGKINADNLIFTYLVQNGATINLYAKWSAKVTFSYGALASAGYTWNGDNPEGFYMLGKQIEFTTVKSSGNSSSKKYSYAKFTIKTGVISSDTFQLRKETKYSPDTLEVTVNPETALNATEKTITITGPTTITVSYKPQ